MTGRRPGPEGPPAAKTRRPARRPEPGPVAQAKLEVVRAAFEHAFPVADVEQLLEEIESGYRGPA